jgi:sugar lactone lactonase YvrE
VFVSNVLSGAVTRLNLIARANGTVVVKSMTQIASGYTTACNAAAVVVGPTGLAYDPDEDILYVASTADNEIFAVSRADDADGDHGPGRVIYRDNTHLHGPLALALAPSGHLITANGDAINPDPSQFSEIVEFTPAGRFVSQFQIDPAVGSAFGLAITRSRGTILFAAVDDNTSVLDEWRE